MCFAHSGTPSEALHVQAGIGPAAAFAFAELSGSDGLGTVDVAGSGTPDASRPHAGTGCWTAMAGSCTTAGTATSSPR